MNLHFDIRPPLIDRYRVADAVVIARVGAITAREHRGEEGTTLEIATVELRIVDRLHLTGDIGDIVTVPLVLASDVDGDPLSYLGGEGTTLVIVLQTDAVFGAAIQTALLLADDGTLVSADPDDPNGRTTLDELRKVLEELVVENEELVRARREWEPDYEAVAAPRLREVGPGSRAGRSRLAEAEKVAAALSAKSVGEPVDVDEAERDRVEGEPER